MDKYIIATFSYHTGELKMFEAMASNEVDAVVFGLLSIGFSDSDVIYTHLKTIEKDEDKLEYLFQLAVDSDSFVKIYKV